MAEKELNNTVEFIALRDNSSKSGHEFSGAKLIRVDSKGHIFLDFGNDLEAPVQSIPKCVNTFSVQSNGVGIQYLPIEGSVSVASAASVHTVKSLMPRKYKIIGMKVNARISTLGAGEDIEVRVMDNASPSAAAISIDGDTYSADTILEWTGDVDMTSDYLAIRFDPTNAGSGTIDNIHIGIELIPLEE